MKKTIIIYFVQILLFVNILKTFLLLKSVNTVFLDLAENAGSGCKGQIRPEQDPAKKVRCDRISIRKTGFNPMYKVIFREFSIFYFYYYYLITDKNI